ncbi:CbtB domain-containing protein [Thalassospiraceae bacterium LMO-SO8]|jgi:cobalt transporter subunit CbtB|nr:CbtB-domain containing protein [Alphaproteobacteria bacterium LMO-S08]WND77324.1 CbtB domain-containing protein [Thalassospiraceae bacterium LMO-SO8]
MTTQTNRIVTTTAAERAMPAALALLFGVFLLFGTGFAHPEAIHNAAHDTRHAFAFPCH